jgi:hypothetical protein
MAAVISALRPRQSLSRFACFFRLLLVVAGSGKLRFLPFVLHCSDWQIPDINPRGIDDYRLCVVVHHPLRMSRSSTLRRHFLAALWKELGIVWPILSGLIGFQLALGVAVGFFEGWPARDAAYFTFVTGLTIGYGDLVPSHLATRIAALVIGFSGILLTGLIAAVGVRALQQATDQTNAD